MKLYLVRHGEPVAKELNPDRPLTMRGRGDVGKVGAFIAGLEDVKVEFIFHSGKTRALQTAEIIAEHLKPKRGVEKADGIGPLDDPSLWVERLSGAGKDTMLVGHLPFMNRLFNRLVGRGEDEALLDFRAAGMVCLERLESGEWLLEWMLIPGILR